MSHVAGGERGTAHEGYPCDLGVTLVNIEAISLSLGRQIASS